MFRFLLKEITGKWLQNNEKSSKHIGHSLWRLTFLDRYKDLIFNKK